jgi:hypothetical protein
MPGDFDETMMDAIRVGMRIRTLADSDVELDQALRRRGAEIRMQVYKACDMLGMPYPTDGSDIGAYAGFFACMDAPIDFGEEDE